MWKHWVALGAFYPFSRAHYAGRGDEIHKEPWSFGPEAEDVARTAMQRRYRLLPYLYTLFHEASVTGLPVMRPLFFADADDLSLRDEQAAFMLGADLIVVPQWAEDVDLPQGQWRQVRLLNGHAEDDAYQPRLLQRAGSIIPLGPVVQHTTGYTADPLTLLVHLDDKGQAEGVLYEDDYDGYGYRDGAFRITRFTARREDGRVTVDAAREAGDMPAVRRQIEVRVMNP